MSKRLREASNDDDDISCQLYTHNDDDSTTVKTEAATFPVATSEIMSSHHQNNEAAAAAAAAPHHPQGEDKEMNRHFLDKQSRTIGTYGIETMAKLISFKVLIAGCGGVGVETAKNLALAGVHTITLFDQHVVSVADQGVNFAVTEETVTPFVKQCRAAVTRPLIAELNPNVRVNVVKELTEEVVGTHNCVVFTSAAPNLGQSTLTRWNKFCREHSPPISFIFAFQGGAIGSVFADHAPQFTVKDIDGRPITQKSILEVITKQDKSGNEYSRIRYETPEGQTPGALRDYTELKFSDVVGLVGPDGQSINNQSFKGVVCPGDPRDTVRVYPSFKQQGFSEYETGGFLHEQKETVTLSFRSFSECLQCPGAFVPVSPMMDNFEESRVHLAIASLLRFADQHEGRVPRLHNKDEAAQLVAIAQAINEENKTAAANAPEPQPEVPEAPQNEEFPARLPRNPPATPLVLDEVDAEFVAVAAKLAAAELQPLGAFFGGVVAQEVVKLTGKYAPIHQWFHLDSTLVLPEDKSYTSSEFHPTQSRYDHLTSIFGKTFVNKILNLKLFMAGCGALGCENIKNFALCGITCGEKGTLVVTDNDRIEVSNLSRQFLFREDNVGQPKSVAAASRMKAMNKDAHIDAMQEYIGPKTEHIFNDKFWMSLDGVVNALDNMETRLYVDQHCVNFHRILVEAGTMGTGGNIDIVVPGKSASYADGGGADQTGGIPMCTLRNFPYIFDHCIEWARAQFDDLFVSPMQLATQLIEAPEAFTEKIKKEISSAESAGQRRGIIEKNLQSLKQLNETLRMLNSDPTMESCAAMAWAQFHALFRDRIRDLQESFPRDAKKKNGDNFWSGHRKYPTALEITQELLLSNEDVQNFIISATNLYACMRGIHSQKYEPKMNDENNRWMAQYRTPEFLQEVTKNLTAPPYVRGSVDGLDDDVAAEKNDTDGSADKDDEAKEAELQALLKEVVGHCHSVSSKNASPLDFEKDDDDNFHIDFIAAASNLRAINYQIPTQDRMKVKLVAGKIIPAIATTTAAVTGLSLLEFFKVLQNKDVSTLRNGMIDVGSNNYVLFERDTPIKHRTKVVKTYLPEQDYTYRKKVICVPEGYTKYDQILIPTTKATTVQEFADKVVAELNKTLPEGSDKSYDLDGVGVGKGLLWNGRKSHGNTNKSLMDVIEQQKIMEAGGELPKPFWENRTMFFDLELNISIDDDEEGVDEVEVDSATIVLTIQE